MAFIDSISKTATVFSVCLAAFAAWKALPLDVEVKQLQAETQRLDLALKRADAELKAAESNRKITLELYTQVKTVIEKKDKDSREEEAVRVLVESLADDPFRWKLLNVIANGAKTAEVRQTAAETSQYYKEEQQVQASQLQTPPALPTAGTGSFNVDFFYCEKKKATSEPLARTALAMKTPTDTGRWRLRSLPESINQQPGYGIDSNLVRFNPPEERPIADTLVKMLASKNITARPQEIVHATPGYVSVFICQ